jgi:methyl-accepting chemotaxis protein
MRAYLTRASVAVKLALMLAVPVVALLFFALSGVAVKRAESSSTGQVVALTHVMRAAGAFVHEAQKERGFSGPFVKSAGKKFAAELPAQRRLTDAKLAALHAELRRSAGALNAAPEVATQLREAMAWVGKLSAHRAKVDALSITPPQASGFFTDMNAEFVDVNRTIASTSRAPELSRELLAYAAWFRTKELAGVERAVMGPIFQAGRFSDPEGVVKLVGAVRGQEDGMRQFDQLADRDTVAFARRTLTGPVAELPLTMRGVALRSLLGGDISSVKVDDWVPAQTARINLMKKVEDRISARVLAHATRLHDDASAALRLYWALTLLSLAVAVALSWRLIRGIVRPLGDVSRALVRISSQGDLGEPLETHGRDEIGRVGVAYNDMREYLEEVADAAGRVAEGDLTTEVALRSERDRLGGAFSKMTRSLRGLIAEVGEHAERVASSAQQMAATSEEAGRAVGEIAHAIADVAGGAQRQVQGLESARRTTDQVTEFTGRSAGQAQATAGLAADAREVAREGEVAVTQATEAMSAVREASAQATEAIGALGDKSQRIGGIVDTITGLAEQTNLLALNAAIEAARAGEQGRGFAVVAEEVRKLAEGSQEAAEQIARLIGEIQAETGRAVEVVEDGARRTGEGAATVEQARASFERIGAAVEEVTGRVGEIAAAVSDIAASAERVRDDITEVVSVAEETSASTEQVSASTQQTSASTQQVSASAHDLARSAQRLNELVASFAV